MASTDVNTRFQEWTEWYYANVSRIPPEDLKKRLDFLQKMTEGLIELMALTISQRRTADAMSKLYVPKGIMLHGDDGGTKYHPLKGV